ncbi:MAG: histidine kinase, partial [Pseudomonadota bacterium]
DEEVPGFALLTTKARGAPARLGANIAPIAIAAGGEAQELWLHAGWDRASALLSGSCELEETEAPQP